eukprot:Gb_10638 [translate_table: standard]
MFVQNARGLQAVSNFYVGMMFESAKMPQELIIPVLVICIVCIVAFYVVHSSSRRSRLPPSPRALPIIGHLRLLGPLPHQSLSNLAKRWGPLMYLRLGSVNTIVATSTDMAAEILKKHGHVFANRPKTIASDIIAYNSTSIAFSPYNAYLREARKICISHLFSPKRLEVFQNLRREEGFEFLKSVWEASQESKPMSINPHVVSFNSSNISRMAFDKKYVCGGEEGETQHNPEYFKKLIYDVFQLTGAFNISDFIPWLRWLDLQGYEKRMIQVRKKLDDLFDEIVEQHILQNEICPKDESARDLVDVLLIASKSEESKIKFTKDNIKSIGTDMFNGGVDTVTVTSEWAMAELIRNPEILKKMQQEMDAVVGKDRRVDELDLPNLKYLQCVMKETFRLHSPAPVLIPHESTEDCTIAGYRIPAKTRALVNIWAISRDPSVWENPLEFIPERFENKDIDPYGQHIELIPGGAGRRMCPALMLGLTMFQLILANLVQGFNWNVAPPLEAETLDMSETFGLTLPRKEPLLLVATPRLQSHLYTHY